MLVRVANAVNVQKPRRNQSARAGFRGRWPFTKKFDLEAALLASFAQGGLFGVFIQLDMPANREPFVQLSMMHEEHTALFDNENRDREIDLFMNMRHAGRTLEPAGAFVNRATSVLVGDAGNPLE
jgi:hypothetical protein